MAHHAVGRLFISYRGVSRCTRYLRCCDYEMILLWPRESDTFTYEAGEIFDISPRAIGTNFQTSHNDESPIFPHDPGCQCSDCVWPEWLLDESEVKCGIYYDRFTSTKIQAKVLKTNRAETTYEIVGQERFGIRVEDTYQFMKKYQSRKPRDYGN